MWWNINLGLGFSRRAVVWEGEVQRNQRGTRWNFLRTRRILTAVQESTVEHQSTNSDHQNCWIQVFYPNYFTKGEPEMLFIAFNIYLNLLFLFSVLSYYWKKYFEYLSVYFCEFQLNQEYNNYCVVPSQRKIVQAHPGCDVLREARPKCDMSIVHLDCAMSRLCDVKAHPSSLCQLVS